MYKIKLLSLLFCFLFLSTSAQNLPIYKNASKSIDERVDDLMKRMTLEEKLAQLQCMSDLSEVSKVPNKGLGFIGYVYWGDRPRISADKFNVLQKAFVENTRLGIPVLYHSEAVYGLAGNGNTSFPASLGQAATFNIALQEKMAHAIGLETKARGHKHVLSPVVNIAYDSRWGRTQETYGEDPFLVSAMGVAYVKPMEAMGIATTAKHFAANIGHNGKFGGTVYFSERFFREVEFPPYKALVKQGNCSGVMSAYNTIDGVPCSANKWLLSDILRNEWGFKGIVVSDYQAVINMYDKFFTATDSANAAIQALNAGLDVELPNIETFGLPLLNAVKSNKISIEVIDNAVKRVLYIKFKIGLFENPYAEPNLAEKYCDSPEHRSIAREVAEQAVVLMKNDNNTLPFSKDIKSIAVIGPLGNAYITNHYAGYGTKRITILEGIKNKVGNKIEVLDEKGVEIAQMALPSIPSEYLFCNDNGTERNGLKGEYFQNMKLEGKPLVTRIDNMVDFNWGEGIPHPFLTADNYSVRWTGYIKSPVTGKYKIGITFDDGARLYINNQLIIDDWKNGASRLVTTEINLEKGKQYDVRYEYFENGYNAMARLGWDATSGNIPRAVELAQKADAIVVCVGAVDNEGADRADLNLSPEQTTLVKAIATLGKPFVVILATGTVVTMTDWIDQAPAVLEAWYPGVEGGNAIADILFGDVNPGGKLPITFPKATGQLPMFYHQPINASTTSYIGVGNAPLFPFGHGLSYTSFEYSDIKLSASKIKATDSITVSVTVKNVGKKDGDEVVQLYIKDKIASVQRPIKLLRGFNRIHLAVGESKTIRYTIGSNDLGMYNQQMKWIVETGQFDILIGSSSEDIRQKALLVVE